MSMPFRARASAHSRRASLAAIIAEAGPTEWGDLLADALLDAARRTGLPAAAVEIVAGRIGYRAHMAAREDAR